MKVSDFMFFEQFNKLCIENNTTPTKFVTETLHLSSSKVTAWKNGSIPKYETLNSIANYFKVTIGYLFDGKENIVSSQELSADEQRLLQMYSLLSDMEKGEILGELKMLTKNRENIKKNDNIQTVYMAARSFDNHPPEMVTGDFSDILNAPDATDEY